MIPSSSITMGKSTTIPSNRDIRGPIPYQRRTFRPKTSKWLIKVSISSFQRTLIRRISPRWRILTWCRREGDFTGRFAPRPAGRRAERGAPLSDETKAAPETAQSWLSIPPLDVKFPADGSSWRVSQVKGIAGCFTRWIWLSRRRATNLIASRQGTTDTMKRRDVLGSYCFSLSRGGILKNILLIIS